MMIILGAIKSSQSFEIKADRNTRKGEDHSPIMHFVQIANTVFSSKDTDSNFSQTKKHHQAVDVTSRTR